MDASRETRFDRDTALVPVDGGFEARIDRGWWIVAGPNGGYVAAILLRAIQQTVGGEREPILLTTHYLRPPAEGPAFVSVDLVREGRSVSTVTARMHQEGRLLAFATAALSVARDGGSEFCDLTPPAVPPPEECPAFPPPDAPVVVPVSERYEYRRAIGDLPWSAGERAEVGGWVRTEDGRETDALLVAALTDAWIPALFSKLDAPGTAVPTVELSVYFRGPSALSERAPIGSTLQEAGGESGQAKPAQEAVSHDQRDLSAQLSERGTGALPRPAGEWVLARFQTNVAAAGYIEEDGELWSADGVLLAQSRQLAVLAPLPPG